METNSFTSSFREPAKTVGFIALLVAALLVFDNLTATVFDQLYKNVRTGQTGGKINQYLSLASTPDVLIMGNSRALYQIIPDSISPTAFNISHAGMGPGFQTGLLSILAQKNRLPKKILLHIEPSDFTTEQSNTDIQNLKFYYHENSYVRDQINRISKYEKYKYWFSMYRYNGRLMPLIKNLVLNREETNLGGYEWISPTPHDSINTIYSYEKAKAYKEAAFNQDQLLFLEAFLDLCAQHNIQVVAFTSPLFNHLNQFPIATHQLVQFLTQRNIPFIRLTDAEQVVLSDPFLWKDAFHLNHSGAQIQSRLISEKLKNLWLN